MAASSFDFAQFFLAALGDLSKVAWMVYGMVAT
jgi:hypothetical protein